MLQVPMVVIGTQSVHDVFRPEAAQRQPPLLTSGAVHDGVAAVQLVLVVDLLDALLGEVVARVDDPPAGGGGEEEARRAWW